MDIHLEPFLMGEKSIQLAHSWGFQRSPWFSLQDAEAGIKCSLNILLMILRIKDRTLGDQFFRHPSCHRIFLSSALSLLEFFILDMV